MLCAPSSPPGGDLGAADSRPVIGRRVNAPKARRPATSPPDRVEHSLRISHTHSPLHLRLVPFPRLSPSPVPQDAQEEWRYGDAPPPFRFLPVDFVRDNEAFRGMVDPRRATQDTPSCVCDLHSKLHSASRDDV